MLNIEFFENPNAIFYSGAQIIGKVLLDIDHSEVRSVELELVGEAYTDWTVENFYSPIEYAQNNVSKRTGQETIVNKHLTVTAITTKSSLTQCGRSECSFVFTLPERSPSTFRGKHGSIGDCIKATCGSHTFSRSLCVVAGHVTIEPLQIEMQKTFGLWCCKTGSVVLTMSVPVQRFVAGEDIRGSLMVHNNSSRVIKRVALRLIRGVKFTTQIARIEYHDSLNNTTSLPTSIRYNDTRTENKTLCGWKHEQTISAGDEIERNDVILKIPNDADLVFGCSLINISYNIVVRIIPSGCNMKQIKYFTIQFNRRPTSELGTQ